MQDALGGKLLGNPMVQKAMEVFPDISETLKTIASVAIPPPGNQVVAAAIEVAHIVCMELRNNQCCMELAQDCLKIMAFISEPIAEAAIKRSPNMSAAADVSVFERTCSCSVHHHTHLKILYLTLSDCTTQQ